MARKKATRRGNGEGTIYQRKDGTWAGAITIGAKPNGKPDRPFRYGKTRAEVVKKLNILKEQARKGQVIKPEKLTFGDWLMFYLENYVQPNVDDLSTYDNYVQLAEDHIIPRDDLPKEHNSHALGTKPLQKLTTGDIQTFYKWLQENGSLAKIKDEETGEMVLKGGGLAPATIVRIHNIIKPALSQAAAEGKIETNPAAAARPPKVEKKEMETLEQEEVGMFLASSTGYRYYPSYVLGFSTGWRRGEILGLIWPNFDIGTPWSTFDKKAPWDAIYALPEWDTEALYRLLVDRAQDFPFMEWEQGIVYVRKQLVLTKKQGIVLKDKPKTPASERGLGIPLETVLTLIFQRARQRKEKAAYEKKNPGSKYNPNALVFCTKNGTPVPPRGYTRNFQAALKSCGLKRIRFHDTRHTVATVLLEEGEQLNTVAEVLGHTDPSFTAKQYGHVTKRMRNSATGKLGNMLAAGKPKQGK